MKLLTIYNICGISQKENVNFYIDSLRTIVNQKNIDHDIVVSSCLSQDSTLSKINNIFPQIKINSINDKVPVNVSFNHTASVFDDNHDAFLYIDSGVSFNTDSVIEKMAEKINAGPYAMISCMADGDNGPLTDAKIAGHVPGKGFIIDQNNESCIPIGSALNAHCQIFTREIKDYYQNIIPDIFAGFCTESVYSFLCAAIKKRWVVCKDIIVNHRLSLDGASSGFDPRNWILLTGRDSYDHPFAIDSYMDRIFNPLAHQYGLGFEECRNILEHDPDQYDENMFCKNNYLKKYIKDNLYLKPEEFDYTNINHTIIGA
jgi:hypothetical protein